MAKGGACSCGIDHDAVKLDPVAWEQLTPIGYQRFPADDTGPRQVLEYRNCPANGTLVLDVTNTDRDPDLNSNRS